MPAGSGNTAARRTAVIVTVVANQRTTVKLSTPT